MSAPMIRVRLIFENYSALFGIPSPSCWFLVDTENISTIGQLENVIKSRFDVPGQSKMSLKLDGFLLPSQEKTIILRDNDTLRVKIHTLMSNSSTSVQSDVSVLLGEAEGQQLYHQERGNTPLSSLAKSNLCGHVVESTPIRSHDGMDFETSCIQSKGKNFLELSNAAFSTKSDNETQKVVQKKKRKKKEKVEISSSELEVLDSREKSKVEKNKKKDKKEDVKKRKRSASFQTSDKEPEKKKKKLKPVKSKSNESSSVSKNKSNIEETVISSSESDSEGDGKPSNNSKLIVKNTVIKKTLKTKVKPVVVKKSKETSSKIKPVVVKKSKETSSSSSSSTDDDAEEGRKGLGFSGKPKGNVSAESDDSEAAKKAAANAEAEHQLEEFLSNIDANTKARRRRKKRENQKRRRKNKMGSDYLEDVNEVDRVGTSNEQLHVPVRSSQPGPESMINGKTDDVEPNVHFVEQANGVDNFNHGDNFVADDLKDRHGEDYKRGKDRKKHQFHTLTKEQQLNSSYTNCSYVYENPVDADEAEEQEPELDPEEEPTLKDYSGFPLLEALPRRGDKMAYKVLELSENYTPEISSYIECEVIVADVVTSTLVVKLLTLPKEKAVGKFDLIDEDNNDESRPNTCDVMSLAWASLIEPRLIS